MWYIREEILSKTRNSVSTGDKSKISAGYFISKVVIDALIYQFMSLFSVKLLWSEVNLHGSLFVRT